MFSGIFRETRWRPWRLLVHLKDSCMRYACVPNFQIMINDVQNTLKKHFKFFKIWIITLIKKYLNLIFVFNIICPPSNFHPIHCPPLSLSIVTNPQVGPFRPMHIESIHPYIAYYGYIILHTIPWDICMHVPSLHSAKVYCILES